MREERRRIKIGKNQHIEAYLIRLQKKNLILLRGRRGYIMCGYLNLGLAQKCKDVAMKIAGVSSIKDALSANIHSLTPAAKRIGVYKGQSVREALKNIA